MPNIQNSANQDFSVFDSMSDEDLEKLLWNDFSKPMGEESDTEQLSYITEVLAKRRKDRNEGKSPAEAWESFKQNYCTETDPSCIPESVPAPQENSSKRWKWSILATAAVLAVVICVSSTASAGICDREDPVATWTDEMFYFVNPESSDFISSPIPQNVTRRSLMPTWIPEGYELINTAAGPGMLALEYMNGDKFMSVLVSDGSARNICKDDGPVKVYRANGINYYLFTNIGRRIAVWYTENRTCSIIGPLSEEEILKMIESIGKD